MLDSIFGSSSQASASPDRETQHLDSSSAAKLREALDLSNPATPLTRENKLNIAKMIHLIGNNTAENIHRNPQIFSLLGPTITKIVTTVISTYVSSTASAAWEGLKSLLPGNSSPSTLEDLAEEKMSMFEKMPLEELSQKGFEIVDSAPICKILTNLAEIHPIQLLEFILQPKNIDHFETRKDFERFYTQQEPRNQTDEVDKESSGWGFGTIMSGIGTAAATPILYALPSIPERDLLKTKDAFSKFLPRLIQGYFSTRNQNELLYYLLFDLARKIDVNPIKLLDIMNDSDVVSWEDLAKNKNFTQLLKLLQTRTETQWGNLIKALIDQRYTDHSIDLGKFEDGAHLLPKIAEALLEPAQREAVLRKNGIYFLAFARHFLESIRDSNMFSDFKQVIQNNSSADVEKYMSHLFAKNLDIDIKNFEELISVDTKKNPVECIKQFIELVDQLFSHRFEGKDLGKYKDSQDSLPKITMSPEEQISCEELIIHIVKAMQTFNPSKILLTEEELLQFVDSIGISEDDLLYSFPALAEVFAPFTHSSNQKNLIDFEAFSPDPWYTHTTVEVINKGLAWMLPDSDTKETILKRGRKASGRIPSDILINGAAAQLILENKQDLSYPDEECEKLSKALDRLTSLIQISREDLKYAGIAKLIKKHPSFLKPKRKDCNTFPFIKESIKYTIGAMFEMTKLPPPPPIFKHQEKDEISFRNNENIDRGISILTKASQANVLFDKLHAFALGYFFVKGIKPVGATPKLLDSLPHIAVDFAISQTFGSLTQALNHINTALTPMSVEEKV